MMCAYSQVSRGRALARLRVRQPGEVIELSRENVLALVQTDAELSEILMRAFILRRVELLTQGVGDAPSWAPVIPPTRPGLKNS